MPWQHSGRISQKEWGWGEGSFRLDSSLDSKNPPLLSYPCSFYTNKKEMVNDTYDPSWLSLTLERTN